MIIETLQAVMIKNSIITAFVFVAVVMWVSYWLSDRLTRGHVHGSAIAIALGLLIAYVGGAFTGGSKGIADIPMLTGVGILGGAMFRDFAIVATAFGADLDSIRKAGWVGAMSVILGGCYFVHRWRRGCRVVWVHGRSFNQYHRCWCSNLYCWTCHGDCARCGVRCHRP